MIVAIIAHKNVRIPHTSQKGEIISKVPILIGDKTANIYCQTPIGCGQTIYDSMVYGQKIVVEKQGNYYKLAEDQSLLQNGGTQAEQVQAVFNGTDVTNREPQAPPVIISPAWMNKSEALKQIDETEIIRASQILCECIKSIRSKLPEEFSAEDCRTAGISLFIFLTKN